MGQGLPVKFTTLIPTHWNDGTSVRASQLSRIIDEVWRPFKGMTKEGPVTGYWIDDDGTHYSDESIKLSVECPRERLNEAIRFVRRAGRKLRQKAMYFEVTGYDGVQFLRVESA
jgi:hypothetical protein